MKTTMTTLAALAAFTNAANLALQDKMEPEVVDDSNTHSLMKPEPTGLAQVGYVQNGYMKSVTQDQTQIYITLENTSPQPVDLFENDLDGNSVYTARIEVGAKYNMWTYVGHVWWAHSSNWYSAMQINGNEAFIVQPKDSGRTFNINQPCAFNWEYNTYDPELQDGFGTLEGYYRNRYGSNGLHDMGQCNDIQYQIEITRGSWGCEYDVTFTDVRGREFSDSLAGTTCRITQSDSFADKLGRFWYFKFDGNDDCSYFGKTPYMKTHYIKYDAEYKKVDAIMANLDIHDNIEADQERAWDQYSMFGNAPLYDEYWRTYRDGTACNLGD